jgi:hypothetical protein
MPEPIMSEPVTLTVNGQRVDVPSDATVAVAIMMAGADCRKSVTGELRGPLCGMGIEIVRKFPTAAHDAVPETLLRAWRYRDRPEGRCTAAPVALNEGLSVS